MALTDRVQGILLRPRQEWQVIDSEPATVSSLYTGYIAPLAAIGPVARFIGLAIFGISVPFAGAIRVPITTALVQAIVSYALALVGVYVLALIVDALAPSFGGTRNPIAALKVCAYSATASWVAAVFALIPLLSILGILGLYSLYLLYLGLPVLMKVPQERALGYTIAVIVVAVVLFFVVGLIVGSLIAVTV